MSRSSARRGQVEPLAALLALTVVCAGLSLYAGVLDGVLAFEDTSAEPTAELVADRVRSHLAPAGVADPHRLDGTLTTAPDGRRLNVTLACREGTWSVGPRPPVSVDSVTEPVSVRLAPGRIRACRLVVVVWP